MFIIICFINISFFSFICFIPVIHGDDLQIKLHFDSTNSNKVAATIDIADVFSVPQHTSSPTTNDLLFTLLNILSNSYISRIKLDSFLKILSELDILVYKALYGDNSNLSQKTYCPDCANKIFIAIDFIKQDLPDEFTPYNNKPFSPNSKSFLIQPNC